MFKKKNIQEKAATEKSNDILDLNVKIKKHSKPAICFFDFNKSDSALIDEAGFKIFEGSLGPLVSMKNEYNHGHYCLPIYKAPQNLHEYDIFLFDLNNQPKIEYRTEDHNKKEVSTSQNLYYYCSYPKTVFNSAPCVGHTFIAPTISDLSNRDSIIVIFANTIDNTEYEIAASEGGYAKVVKKFEYNNYSFLPSGIRFSKNKNGKCINTIPSNQVFDSFLKKYIDSMEYKVTFYHPTIWENGKNKERDSFTPLLLNNDGDIISYAELNNKQLIFVFPELEYKGQFLKELLESVLPDIVPQLFPEHQRGAWTKGTEYLLPNESDLKLEKEAILQRQRMELDEINNRIEQNKKQYNFLHKILIETGGELVNNLVTFLEWLGYTNVRNMDDEKPNGIKEEDIQIDIESGLLIIEAKGIGGTSKDDECAQISKIRSRRCEERGAFDVFGLYIVNHQRYIPPLQRKNPPFSSDQISDSIHEKRGLITTWDLFQLFNNIEIGVISKEQARHDLLNIGFVEFEPDRIKVLGIITEIFQQGQIIIIKEFQQYIDKSTSLYTKKKGFFIKIQILNIQIDGIDQESASSGEVGIKINCKLKAGDTIYILK